MAGKDKGKNATVLTHKQRQLIRNLALDPLKCYRKAMEAVSHWRKRKEDLRLLNDKFYAGLHHDLLGTLGKLDPFLLSEMIAQADHVDADYVRDLLQGFPITGEVPCCGTGSYIPGGQRVHQKRGTGAAPPLEHLKSRCKELNQKTIAKAQAKRPLTSEEWELAERTWNKVVSDLEAGRVGEPFDLQDAALDDCLLVDTFGIWERHGEAGNWKLRVINNFKANLVNEFAWMPEKLSYNGFDELLEAAIVMKEITTQNLAMGKADFKSAFKTLPPSAEQKWLCYSLVFNPKLGKHQVVPLHCQAFGSLGGVIAWYRTAMMIQCVMQEIFGLVVFVYVDDCFWIVPQFDRHTELQSADWIAKLFEFVVTGLFGWELDPDKHATGQEMVLLGLRITLHNEMSEWSLDDRKSEAWIQDLEQALKENCLTPAQASKLCGRLAFLNCHIFNRLGRALLRPLIWRQHQQRGSIALTRRLRWSLQWFTVVLTRKLTRKIPLARQPRDKKVKSPGMYKPGKVVDGSEG